METLASAKEATTHDVENNKDQNMPSSSLLLLFPPLTKDIIHSAIDEACCTTTAATVVLPHHFQWKRQCERNEHGNEHEKLNPNDQSSSSTSSSSSSLLYSIIGFILESDIPLITVTFYLAYSTWDGRILYIDAIETFHDDNDDDDDNDNTKIWTNDQQNQIIYQVYRILAHIAITLECRRLTWQHTKEKTIVFPNLNTPPPETLHGWLTLHWEKDVILQFLNNRNMDHTVDTATTTRTNEMVVSSSTSSKTSFRNMIEATLQQSNTATTAITAALETPLEMKQPQHQQQRRLRLANINDDVHTIYRLVQGLADFEKEPNAVRVTPNHYLIDGFQSNPPLFYCILYEVVVPVVESIAAEYDNNITEDTNHEKNNNNNWYACGMAFFWIGARRRNISQPTTATINQQQQQKQKQKLESSLFLYLEDLFIEEGYRRNGVGTLIMTTLGKITISIPNCNHMVWQALDWNIPALTFYQNKIGAYIVNGLLTTRYAGSTLHELHNCQT